MLTPQAGIQVDKFYPPTDWLDTNNEQIDIRNAEDNTIVLLYGHPSDLSKYSLFGVFATVSSGTYDVYIDDVKVGDSIASISQYDVDFSTINTSYGTATTPESLVLHKIVIKPTTEGSQITTFRTRRTAGVSSLQYQGVLWCHFELENEIFINHLFQVDSVLRNTEVYALTAKGDEINFLSSGSNTGLYSSFGYCSRLVSLPTFKTKSTTASGFYLSFQNVPAKRVVIKGGSFNNTPLCNAGQEKIYLDNMPLVSGTGSLNNASGASNLKVFPKYGGSSSTTTLLMTDLRNIYPTKIDDSSFSTRTLLRINGTSSYPANGIKGLKVSNEAPFDGAEPQIDVSYTGMTRDALVELFNSLSYNVGYTVVGSPTITDGVVSGFSASDYLRLEKLPAFSGNVEIVIKFKTSTFSGNMASWITNGIQCFVRFNAGKTINVYFSRMGDNSTQLSLSGNYVFSENTDYYVKIIKTEDNKLSVSYSTDGTNYTLDNETQNENAGTVAISSYFRWGVSGAYTPTNPFDGEIDFNKTYIKTNGVPFFRGTAAMTKSINLVGATGTADLTADDKAIATTNKNWSLILS